VTPTRTPHPVRPVIALRRTVPWSTGSAAASVAGNTLPDPSGAPCYLIQSCPLLNLLRCRWTLSSQLAEHGNGNRNGRELDGLHDDERVERRLLPAAIWIRGTPRNVGMGIGT
jgi:hypothetical protein